MGDLEEFNNFAVSQLDNKKIGLGIERLKTSTPNKKLNMISVLG